MLLLFVERVYTIQHRCLFSFGESTIRPVPRSRHPGLSCPFNFKLPNAMQTCVSVFHSQSHQFIRFDFCSFRPDGFFGGCSTVHCTQCTAVLYLFLKRWRKSWTISFCSFRWLFKRRKSLSSKLLPLFFTPSRRVETSLSLYCLFGRLVRNAIVDECVCLCRIQASKKYHDQKENHSKWMFFSLSLHRSKFISIRYTYISVYTTVYCICYLLYYRLCYGIVSMIVLYSHFVVDFFFMLKWCFSLSSQPTAPIRYLQRQE